MVGNGSPDSSNGRCSVTAGCPYGQRTATRRKARGGRPSCRSTSARSSSTLPDRSVAPAPPRGDALDDEQPLARPDERELTRLELERRRARREREPAFEPPLLRPEPANLGLARDERAARVEVGAQRPVVEEGDEDEADERDDAKRPPRPRLPASAP